MKLQSGMSCAGCGAEFTGDSKDFTTWADEHRKTCPAEVVTKPYAAADAPEKPAESPPSDPEE